MRRGEGVMVRAAEHRVQCKQECMVEEKAAARLGRCAKILCPECQLPGRFQQTLLVIISAVTLQP